MADAVGLGASVLAFITIAGKLSKAAAKLYGSFHNAPEEVKRVQTRMNDLGILLSQIERIYSAHPQCVTDAAVQRYWNEKSTKLRDDFATFESFTDRLNTTLGGRVRWFLSHQDRAKSILELLSEDIDMLYLLYQLMSQPYMLSRQADYLDSFLQTQKPVMTNLSATIQNLNLIRANMATKEDLVENCELLLSKLQPKMSGEHSTRRRRRRRTTETPGDIQASNLNTHYSYYHLPIGVIAISYGWAYKMSGEGPLKDEKVAIRGSWEFRPAPWLSHKTVFTEAMMVWRSRIYYSRMTVARNLRVGMDLSEAHPVWDCIFYADVLGLRKLLSSGSVRVNDCGTHSMEYDEERVSLLHYACACLGPRPWKLLGPPLAAPTPAAVEILKLLIESGADCSPLSTDGCGPLPHTISKVFISNPRSEDAVCWSEGTRLLLEAGAEFLPPTDLLALDSYTSHTWAINSSLKGVYHETFAHSFEEYLADLFSKDLSSLDDGQKLGLMNILIDFTCGWLGEFQHLWKEARLSVPNDEHSVFVGILKEIVFLTECFADPRSYLKQLVNKMFESAGKCGRVSKANLTLSALIDYSPTLAEQLVEPGLPRHYAFSHILYGGNEETLAILSRAGLAYEKSCWWRMIAPWDGEYPDISVWQRYVRDDVDPVVLNWILVQILPGDWVYNYKRTRFSTDHLAFLLDNGADVNYVAPHISDPIRRTPLGLALDHGEVDNVYFLLEHGADVLLETKWGAFSDMASACGYRNLAKRLKYLENEEKTKRNLSFKPNVGQTMTVDNTHYGLNYAVLAIGILLIAYGAVRNGILYIIGWVFRNRLLIWQLCYMGVCLGCIFLQEFGWALCGTLLESFL